MKTQTPHNIEWFRTEAVRGFQKTGKSQGTIRQLKSQFNRLIAFLGRDFIVEDINPDHIIKYREYLLKEGMRPVSVNNLCRYLKVAFDVLIESSVINKNPLHNLEALDEKPLQNQAFTVEQLEILLRTIESWFNRDRRFNIERYIRREDGKRRLVYMLLYTGRRRSEIMLIERDDIFLEDDRMYVMNILSRNKGKQSIPIPLAIKNDITWFLKNYHSSRPFDICNHEHLSLWFKKMVRLASLPDHLQLKSLKHTFISLALEAGEPIWKIRELLGHASTTIPGYETQPQNAIKFKYDFTIYKDE